MTEEAEPLKQPARILVDQFILGLHHLIEQAPVVEIRFFQCRLFRLREFAEEVALYELILIGHC